MKLPKYNLLYYKALIDKCFLSFFTNYNNSFIKNSNNNYILADNFSKNKLKTIFKKYLSDEIKLYVKPYNLLEPNYFLIIGACQPKNNLLLKFKDDNYFPEKLNKIINYDFQIKYLIKEQDIKLDLIKFNQVLFEIFLELFKSQHKLLQLIGKEYKNVFFIQHSKLDCYSMFKTIKFLYGKNNCWNIYKEQFYNIKSPIIAINDLIDKYIHNKINMNKSLEFKLIVQEVKQYIDELIQQRILNNE